MTRVKVGIRARSLTEQEEQAGDEVVIAVSGNSVVLKRQDTNCRANELPGRRFCYDYCFWSVDPTCSNFASQKTIYESVGVPIVKSLLEGYNACVFAYGQSGSGKSYTITGTRVDVGLLPRLCDDLFFKIRQRIEAYRTKISFSFVEIYKEKVHDLLNITSPCSNENLRVREHPLIGPFIQGLTKQNVSSVEDVMRLIENARNNRNFQSVAYDQNKRSHSIYTISCSQESKSNLNPCELVSELHLVDLAGSETVPLSGSLRDNQDITNINKSLVTLGIVISTLASRSCTNRHSYVPFRNSVLTWLLKETLGGNCITCMIATISPSSTNYKDTLSTLRYAERAGNILNRPVINESPKKEFKLLEEIKEDNHLFMDILARQEIRRGLNLEKIIIRSRALDTNSVSDADSLNDIPEIITKSESKNSSMEDIGANSFRKIYKSLSYDSKITFNQKPARRTSKSEDYMVRKCFDFNRFEHSSMKVNEKLEFEPDGLDSELKMNERYVLTLKNEDNINNMSELSEYLQTDRRFQTSKTLLQNSNTFDEVNSNNEICEIFEDCSLKPVDFSLDLKSSCSNPPLDSPGNDSGFKDLFCDSRVIVSESPVVIMNRHDQVETFSRRPCCYSTDSVEGYNNVTSCETLSVKHFQRRQNADLKSLAFVTQQAPLNFGVLEEPKIPFTLRDPGTPDSGFASSRVFPCLRNSVWPNQMHKPNLEIEEITQEEQFRDAETTSSSTSSDSITYVFIDQRLSSDYRENLLNDDVKCNERTSVIGLPPLSDRNRRRSTANSSLTLDSLEVSKDDEFSKSCKSPRALSVDSLVAEEYFKMLNSSAGQDALKQLKDGRFQVASPFIDNNGKQEEFCYGNKVQAVSKVTKLVTIPSANCSSESSIETSKLCHSRKTSVGVGTESIDSKLGSKETVKQTQIDGDLLKLMSDVVGLLTTLQKQQPNQKEANTENMVRRMSSDCNSCCCRSIPQNTMSLSSSSSGEPLSTDSNPSNGKSTSKSVDFRDKQTAVKVVDQHRTVFRKSLKDEIRLLRKERDHVVHLLQRQNRRRWQTNYKLPENPFSKPNASEFAENCAFSCNRNALTNRTFKPKCELPSSSPPHLTVTSTLKYLNGESGSCLVNCETKQKIGNRSSSILNSINETSTIQSFTENEKMESTFNENSISSESQGLQIDAKFGINRNAEKASKQLSHSAMFDLLDDFFGQDQFLELPNEFKQRNSFYVPLAINSKR